MPFFFEAHLQIPSLFLIQNKDQSKNDVSKGDLCHCQTPPNFLNHIGVPKHIIARYSFIDLHKHWSMSEKEQKYNEPCGRVYLQLVIISKSTINTCIFFFYRECHGSVV